jgi:hypothetical protein
MTLCDDIRRQLAAQLLESGNDVCSIARGGSMLPTIFPGDTLEIRRRHFEQLKPGDVALAMNGGHLCTHRVVREEIRSGRRVLITRGDALRREDEQPVSCEEFVGCVEGVIRRGLRFRPQMSEGYLHSALRGVLRRSGNMTLLLLHLHSLVSRVSRLVPGSLFRFAALSRGVVD